MEVEVWGGNLFLKTASLSLCHPVKRSENQSILTPSKNVVNVLNSGRTLYSRRGRNSVRYDASAHKRYDQAAALSTVTVQCVCLCQRTYNVLLIKHEALMGQKPRLRGNFICSALILKSQSTQNWNSCGKFTSMELLQSELTGVRCPSHQLRGCFGSFQQNAVNFSSQSADVLHKGLRTIKRLSFPSVPRHLCLLFHRRHCWLTHSTAV